MNIIYRDEYIDLIQGECLEVMEELITQGVKFDAIITDPPYGTSACKWDVIIPLDNMWERLNMLISDSGTICLFGGQPFTSLLIASNLKMFRYNWIWKSNRAANFAQAPYMPLKNTEDIVVFSKATIAQNSKNRMVYNPQGLEDVEKVCAGKKANDHRPNRKDQKPYIQLKTGYPSVLLEFDKELKPVHPTQKPTDLLEYIINTYTNEGDLILDFTCGSGSTLIAAKKLHRRCIGIELEEKYCEIAIHRIQEANK